MGHLSPPSYEPGNEARTACNWAGSLRLHESVCPSSVHPQEWGSVVACMSPVGLANFKQPRVVGMWVGFGVVSLADPVLSVVPDKGWNSVSIHVVLGACVMYH